MMLRYTKKVMHIIYTIEINAKSNYIKIFRGRKGQSDQVHILTHNKFICKDGNSIQKDIYGNFIDEYGIISESMVEKIIQENMTDILKKIEKKIKKKRLID